MAVRAVYGVREATSICDCGRGWCFERVDVVEFCRQRFGGRSGYGNAAV